MKSVIEHWIAVLRGDLSPNCFWIALNEWEPNTYGLWWIYDENAEGF